MEQILQVIAAMQAEIERLGGDVAHVRQNTYFMDAKLERFEKNASKRLDANESAVRTLVYKNDAALRIDQKTEREISKLINKRVCEELGLPASVKSTLYAELRTEFGCGNSYKNLLVIHVVEARQFIRQWLPKLSSTQTVVIEPKRWDRLRAGNIN
jgi:hypothetical protein